MKKLALILAFLMLVPGAAFGLEMLNDGAMDEVTGQAGVGIFADDVQMFLNIERIAWIDTDGFETTAVSPYGGLDCEGIGGAIGISNFQIDVITINGIVNSGSAAMGQTMGYGWAQNLGSVTAGELNLNWDYGSTAQFAGASIAGNYARNSAYVGMTMGTQTLGLNNYNQDANQTDFGEIQYQGLIINASSQMPAATEGYTNMNLGSNGTFENGTAQIGVGGVMIGLPTMEFYIPNMTMTPAFYNLEGYNEGGLNPGEAVNDFDGNTNVRTMADGADYGTIALEGITFTTLSGWIEIGPL